MHKKLSHFQILEKDIAVILMPQTLQTMTWSQNVAAKAVHLIISCSLATIEFSPSNCAPQWRQYGDLLKLPYLSLNPEVDIRKSAENKIMHNL